MYHDVLDQFNSFKEKHEHTIQSYFTWLKESSTINLESNKKTNQQLNEQIKLNKNAISTRAWNIFFKVLIILGIIGLGAYGIFSIYEFFSVGGDGWSIALIILCLGGSIGLIPLLQGVNKQLSQLDQTIKKLETIIKKLTKEAWNQMEPLLSLLEEGTSAILMEKTFPLIDFDGYFDQKRLDILVSRFGLPLNSFHNRSTLKVQSGNIIGNPFFICKERIHTMGQKRYTGTKYIQWSTVVYVNGKAQRQYHSEVLTASLSKPYPLYDEQTYVLYANDAAPDLSFSRVDSDAEHLNTHQLRAKVDSGTKKLQKIARDSLKKGGNFTVLGNNEFDVLWNATDRNHEVQFRLLFTPLAQQELLKIMKEKTIGFGDNFNFIKERKINQIIPEHMQNFDFKISPQFFYHHDYEVFAERFKTYEHDYFRHLYFMFAPLLAIPLYQQMKTPEYVYEDTFDQGASFYEHEQLANAWNINDLKHAQSATLNILKTSLISHRSKKDQIIVEAHSYQAIQRTDVQQIFGGDGRFHNVYIDWIDYRPVVKKTVMDIEAQTKQGIAASWAISTQELKARLYKKG